MVGPEGIDAEESFDITVCTPEWFRQQYELSDVVVARHHLIVFEYDYDRIVNKIKSIIERCEGSSWNEVAEKVARYGYWEFEDYTEGMEMARMMCKCGETLSTVQVPNEIELFVYTDFEMDEINAMEINDPLDIPDPEREVWRCPHCERIYVFDGNKVIRTYVLEEDEEGENGGK